MSISFEELNVEDSEGDISFVPLSDTPPSSSGSGSGSDTGSSRTSGWAGRKWIVDEAKLMEFFRTCFRCGGVIEDKRIATRGSQIRVQWTCLSGHSGEWASCEDQSQIARNNLLVCAATFLTGATYTTIREWADIINIQVTEASGFERGLNHLLSLGVDVGVMATDRSPSIWKIMRESYANIRHEYDPWHVNKTKWEENGQEYTCFHPPLTEEMQKKKRWLQQDSSAFRALKDLVLDQTLLRDLRQMALFKHTGSLEVFHNVMLKYAPKTLHFTYDSMRARTQLAVMDHNMNVGRTQKTTQEGNPRYKYSFSKASQQWVAKPVYETTSQDFLKDLMDDVLKMTETQRLEPWPRPPPRHRRLPQNIAPCPRPEVSELLAQRHSRFQQL
ncbi:hypothetical protein ACEWY4_027925 [Coilia grayii]|uniref:Uncharacterized protein n=1 Tax=Coilia grayii TaxID=363190 RepID=A0ABD1IR37_9TELE